MAFITDKEELKPGLVIFRRADVEHRNWYCRVKLPKADRYKTISLRTPDIHVARDRAYDHDAELRFRIKHDVPVFNRPFSHVAKEYVAFQQKRADTGQVTQGRIKKLESVMKARLNLYVGSIQINLIGQDRWESYPTWRRENSKGRFREQVSDSTIRFEMSIFRAVMNFAATKRYITASQKFEGQPALKKMRRDEFTLEEYRKLHTVGRAWVKQAGRPSSVWYRTIAYNFILIMCNTGMRPSEAKNLRWRDVATAKDRDGRDIIVLSVRGKGKSRQLVAPASVGDYIERVRAIAKVTGNDDPVFTTSTGDPAKSLYQSMIEDVLKEAGLTIGASGIPRSTYCFRHTYATFRLSEGVDVYFLAQQMGTSVKMIEDHYGHVNTVKHAERVLQGMAGWDPLPSITSSDSPKPSPAPRARAPRRRLSEASSPPSAGLPPGASTSSLDVPDGKPA